MEHSTTYKRADLGYAMSTQLPDGSIFTTYYITLSDGITHAAATGWQLDTP